LKYAKILVPAVNIETNKEALNIACELARANEGQIYILNVISVSRDKPLDYDMNEETIKAEQILNELEDYCKEKGCEDVRTELLQARDPGDAIVEYSVDKAVDLIMLSMDHKRRFGELSFGYVMPYVMHHSPCPVLLFHNNNFQAQDHEQRHSEHFGNFDEYHSYDHHTEE